MTTLLADIKMLGKLYDFTYIDPDKSQKFQDLLNEYDNLTIPSDPTIRMLEVSTY